MVSLPEAPQAFVFLLHWIFLWKKDQSNLSPRHLKERRKSCGKVEWFHVTMWWAGLGCCSKCAGSPSDSELFEPLVLKKGRGERGRKRERGRYKTLSSKWIKVHHFKPPGQAIQKEYFTWFPSQTQWSYGLYQRLCPVSLWPLCQAALPAQTDSKSPERSWNTDTNLTGKSLTCSWSQ